jgi:hypothetical protein
MRAALFLALGTLVACGPSMRDGIPQGGDDDGMNNGSNSGSDGVAQQCNKMDIVFVVDDSGSMAEEQQNLATNFPMFAQLLAQYQVDGQPLDFRIGLTTTGRTVTYNVTVPGFPPIPETETGDNGAFKNNCNSSARFLQSGDPSFETTLACRANVGTSGPGIEMPMLMSKYALSERIADGTNGQFVRPDALLAIVYLTDEDDQSTTQDNFTIDATGNPPVDWNPQDQVSFLDQLKGNRTRWAAAAIAGDGDCSSSFGMATDATRLKQFVTLANGNGTTQAVFSSICDGDLTIGLKRALDTFQAACGQIIL